MAKRNKSPPLAIFFLLQLCHKKHTSQHKVEYQTILTQHTIITHLYEFIWRIRP